jgi:hypothetical protein
MKGGGIFDGRSDDDLDALAITEVFLRNLFDVIKRDTLNFVCPALVVVIAESQEFIGRAKPTKRCAGLIPNRLRAK